VILWAKIEDNLSSMETSESELEVVRYVCSKLGKTRFFVMPPIVSHRARTTRLYSIRGKIVTVDLMSRIPPAIDRAIYMTKEREKYGETYLEYVTSEKTDFEEMTTKNLKKKYGDKNHTVGRRKRNR